MTDIPFVKRKIGQSYLVWFKNSNLYFQLEEPAWFVFMKIIKRYKTETISKEFSYRYSLGYEESLKFVKEIRVKIKEMNQLNGKNNSKLHSDNLSKYSFEPDSVYRYKFGNKILEFSFDTDWLEDYIHPLIAYMETAELVAEIPLFELFSYHNKVVFRINNEVKGIWGIDESNLVKGKIFMELVNFMYNKTDKDWLMTVHASAISNGRKTILISAPPGSGKTTMAAMLKAEGYKLISDDFVPIDHHSFNAYPFPIAMSIKEGALNVLSPHFPNISQKPLNYISSEKSVRYVPLIENAEDMIFPVREFIFIKYDANVDFIWEELDPVEAIKLLLEQTWVAPSFRNAEILFEKVLQSSFFKLTYSDNQKALSAISQLFENE